MTCLLCGRPLPPDRRWAVLRWLNPRPPTCPPTFECYSGFCQRLGLSAPTEAEWRDVRARIGRSAT